MKYIIKGITKGKIFSASKELAMVEVEKFCVNKNLKYEVLQCDSDKYGAGNGTTVVYCSKNGDALKNNAMANGCCIILIERKK